MRYSSITDCQDAARIPSNDKFISQARIQE
jgi:hypothetical protein